MGPLKDAVLARLGGDKPSPLRAAVAGSSQASSWP